MPPSGERSESPTTPSCNAFMSCGRRWATRASASSAPSRGGATWWPRTCSRASASAVTAVARGAGGSPLPSRSRSLWPRSAPSRPGARCTRPRPRVPARSPCSVPSSGTPAEEDAILGVGIADALILKLSAVTRLVVRPTSAVLFVGPGDDAARPGGAPAWTMSSEGHLQRAGDAARHRAAARRRDRRGALERSLRGGGVRRVPRAGRDRGAGGGLAAQVAVARRAEAARAARHLRRRGAAGVRPRPLPLVAPDGVGAGGEPGPVPACARPRPSVCPGSVGVADVQPARRIGRGVRALVRAR